MTQNKSIFRKNALDYNQNPLPDIVFPKSMRKSILKALAIGVILLGILVLYLGCLEIPVYRKGYGKFVENREQKESFFTAFLDVEASSPSLSIGQTVWIDCDYFEQPIQAHISKVGDVESPQSIIQLLGDFYDKKTNSPKQALNITIENDVLPYSIDKLNGTICSVKIQIGKKNLVNLF